MLTEEFVPLAPVNYFQIALDCHKLPEGHLTAKNEADYRLPDLSSLCNQHSSSTVSLAWSPLGIFAFVNVHSRLVESHFPAVSEGDSFELFLDTRDVKTS